MWSFVVFFLLCIGSFASCQTWEQLSGKATQISARNRFLITGVPVWMVNPRNVLHRWHWRSGTWEKDRDGVQQVSASFDDSAWAVTTAGEVIRYKEGRWTEVPVTSRIVQISAKNYNEAVGVTAQDEVLHYVDGQWQKLTGSGKWISIEENGDMWKISSRDGQIHRWSAQSKTWKRLPGTGRTIDAFNDNRVVLTNPQHEVFTWNGSGWTKIAGSCKQASITAKNIYCVTPNNGIERS